MVAEGASGNKRVDDGEDNGEVYKCGQMGDIRRPRLLFRTAAGGHRCVANSFRGLDVVR